MTKKHEILLFDRKNKTEVKAFIVDDIDAAAITAAEATWKAYLNPIVEERKARNAEPLTLEHMHWSWEKKAQYVKDDPAFRTFGIEYNGFMQGMMIASLVGHVGRHQEQLGKDLVYVDYLATAPWNNLHVVADPELARVGSFLLRRAVFLSTENDFKGRVGLHSLPQAEAFYVQQEMADLGLDARKDKMRYFEFTPELAKTFTE